MSCHSAAFFFCLHYIVIDIKRLKFALLAQKANGSPTLKDAQFIHARKRQFGTRIIWCFVIFSALSIFFSHVRVP
jgi:hypothetical protein